MKRFPVSTIRASGSFPFRIWGECMSDVILRMPVRGDDEGERLSNALDSFARASADAGSDIFMMMKTEILDGMIIKCLVFDARSHAAAFLSFWRHERRRIAS